MSEQPTPVWISLGSNHDRHYQISRALDALQQAFGTLTISQVYETQPVGLTRQQCAPFYNLIVGFQTQLSVGSLNAFLKAVEGDQKHLLTPDRRVYVRALDLDIVCWGQATGPVEGVQLPYRDLLKHDFVLRPLAELVPDEYLPGSHQTYRHLWQQHQHPDQLMAAVDFTWQGQRISINQQ